MKPTDSPNVLEQIAKDVRQRLEARRELRRGTSLRELAFQSRRPLDLAAALRKNAPSILAEVKLKSPSEGVLAHHPDPAEIAAEYVADGAAAVSILTEQDHFGGRLEYLVSARKLAPEACLLMKDFVIDEEQLYEARACGADAALLIVALLGETRTRELMAVADQLGLSTLVEVHNEDELKIANQLKARVIGVNNRDLKTLQISLDVSRRLASLAHKEAVLVAESGLKTAADVRELYGLGFSAFLIGTSFMKTPDPAEALRRLLKELA